jgi:hypothetical protein
MAKQEIKTTADYSAFERSADNRPVNLKKHKNLIESMKQFGFLKCFPVVCVRSGKSLVVKDGQHRLAVAQMLGLPVHYVEADKDFDIAVINCTSKSWELRDYAAKFAENGHEDYAEGLHFSEQYRISIGVSFCLLAGTTCQSTLRRQFADGDFAVKDRDWAHRVAGTYRKFMDIAGKGINGRPVMEALMAACRVKQFNPTRLLEGAEKHREMIANYSSRDACLTMLEKIYNHNRLAKNLFALKIEAEKAMRDRNPAAKPD